MRSFLPPIRGFRPWHAVGKYDRVRGRYDRYGWFASSGVNCTEPKKIHWGKYRGWLPAWIDSFCLAARRAR